MTPPISSNKALQSDKLVDLKFKNPSVSVSWNVSEYINFTGPPIKLDPLSELYFRIFIDDTDPNYNWSVTAANNSWCTGSGTFADPYVIEGLYIDAGGYGGMISIWNSDKFFVLRNNWFNFSGPYGGDAGVLLRFVENGLIENNIFTYTKLGVKITQISSNIMVLDNIMISDHTTAGFGTGIDVQLSENVTVNNNKVRNYYSPIGVLNSVNATIENNYLENNIFDVYDAPPLKLYRCSNSTMVRNTFAGAYADAAFLISEINSTGNIITNNTPVTGELPTFGPETSAAPKLQADSVAQILIDNSNYNTIAHNILLRSDSSLAAVPGFNPLIVIGMIGVISVLMVLLKRKHNKN